MKSIGKILFLLALMCSVSPFVWAQNAQEEIEEMYQQRQQRQQQQEQLEEALRIAAEEEERVRQENSQKGWETLLGKNAHIFDRERTEQAFSAYLNFQDVYAWIKEKEKIVEEHCNQRNICRIYDPSLPEDTYEIKIITEQIYLPIFEKLPSGKKSVTFNFASSMQITDGPFLLLRKKEQCLLLDSQYKVHELRNCADYAKYLPVSEERKQVLQELGFSKKTIERFALKNPWNLRVYVACDRFVDKKEETELVEKAVIAWRYYSSQTYYAVQYRTILIKEDGKEEEIPPNSDTRKLPLCFDLNEKERNAFYESLTQAPTRLEPGSYARKSGGCGGDYYLDWVYPPKKEIKIDENWFF